ncbi:hypothetical protein V1294_001805 [Bradyrhizobium sp. AZCC 1678]
MAKQKNVAKGAKSGRFVLGNDRFAKISEIEGIKLTPAMKKRAFAGTVRVCDDTKRCPYPSARNSRRSTLPVAVIGSVSANCTKRGYSWAASCTLTNS